MEVPGGFEEHYSGDVVLRMNVPLCITKQAAYCFFKTFGEYVKKMQYRQSRANPCLYFEWVDNALVVLLAWFNDIMILGPLALVEQAQRDLKEAFMCKHEGELTEYVGSKLIRPRDRQHRPSSNKIFTTGTSAEVRRRVQAMTEWH
jgi:hypothetical protein